MGDFTLIDIFVLKDWLSAGAIIFGAVSACVIWIYQKIFRRINRIEEQNIAILEDIVDSTEERIVIMNALKATLEAVSGKRCNGNVDDSIDEIDNYLNVRAHEPKTNMSKRIEKEQK